MLTSVNAINHQRKKDEETNTSSYYLIKEKITYIIYDICLEKIYNSYNYFFSNEKSLNQQQKHQFDPEGKKGVFITQICNCSKNIIELSEKDCFNIIKYLPTEKHCSICSNKINCKLEVIETPVAIEYLENQTGKRFEKKYDDPITTTFDLNIPHKFFQLSIIDKK